MKLRFTRPLLILLCSLPLLAQAKQWTLEDSITQAICRSPELKKSIAEIKLKQADVELSALWPDPSIEFRLDNKLGLDDGRGGVDITDISITQKIPFSRLKYQQSAAQAKLNAADYEQTHKMLLLQSRIARVFHQLQFSSARLALAEKQRQLASELSQSTRRQDKDVIVRYLTPLEKIRLSVVREDAHQTEVTAEGKYDETMSRFKRLVGIQSDVVVKVASLQTLKILPDIKTLFMSQNSHAQLSTQQQLLLAANQQIDLARSRYIDDPSISLIRSRDSFDNGRDNVYGLMFNIQIPIHDRKSTLLSKAKYKANQERIELQRLKRELQINLKSSFEHLSHIYEQASRYQQKVLQPASKILQLTKRGFNSGELNILALVDAHKIYFSAQLQYLELQYQAWSELADVRLFAGQQITQLEFPAYCLAQGGS